jgi:phage shock protein PspC (stress-responsive transcriptional regulator)
MLVAAWSVGLMQAIRALQDWDQLTTEEKVATVASTVYLAGQSILFIPGFLEGLSMTVRGLMQLRLAVYRYFNNTPMAVATLRQTWTWKVGRFMNKLFGGVAKIIDTKDTLLNKLFVGAQKLVRVLGVFVAFVLAGVAAYVFAKSVMEGESQMSQAFNGVMMVSQFIVAVAGVVQIAVASLATAAIAVGAIFAVVGIIFAIVAMFVMPPQNEPPVDKYMREKAKPFVDGLPESGHSWRAMAAFA